MTPLHALRLQKAAADCGFDMTPQVRADAIEMRSVRFPETVLVQVRGEDDFEVSASDPTILGAADGRDMLAVKGFGALYDALRAVAAHARTRPNRVADAFHRTTALLPKTTEAERLVLQRIGQGMFRDALLDYWQGRCCVTGLDIPALLRASHIRPWAQCDTDEQRLDVFNGLLLAPHLDALFDAGMMTVEDNGAVLLAKVVSHRARQQLGLEPSMALQGLQPAHIPYLQFHRTHVWRP